MESDAETGLREHRKVVGPVSDGDGLCQVDLFGLGDQFQQVRFPAAVDDLADIASGQLSVVIDFQLVGIDIVDVVTALEVFSEVGESTAEDGD